MDASFFAENAGIIAVAQADGGQGGAFVQEHFLVFAQLRDVLVAKNSAIVTKEDDDREIVLPQRTQTDFLAVGIGENDVSESLA